MKANKRGLASLLAVLQFALSFGYPGYASAAQVVSQQVNAVVPVQTGPSAPIGQMKLGGPASLQPGALAPVSALSGPGAMVGVPQVQERSFSAAVIGLPVSAITHTAAPIAVPNAPASLTAAQVQLSAPAKALTPSADGQAGPIDIQKTSARVSESLALPGLSRKAPAETSRDAAEQVFASLRGALIMETVHSRALEGNPLGDPASRRIPVYLPPSYGTDPQRRYPVLYYLPAFTGTSQAVIRQRPDKENLIEQYDRLIAQGAAKEAILVVVDGYTAYGGSQYLNSPATGRYEDFVAQELVAHIDGRFRTVPAPEGRALIGKSSGGFGALTLGMRHPDTFGHVVSHSGDAGFEDSLGSILPGFVAALKEYGGSVHRFLKAYMRAARKWELSHDAVNTIAMSAIYSPNPESKLGFDLPVDTRSGRIIPEVWDRWLAFDPVRAAARYTDSLRRLKTIWFDAGTRDEFSLHLGTRRLAAVLTRLGIEHTYSEHDHGHFDLDSRFDISLPLISRRMAELLAKEPIKP